jgi:hypothetical protein
MRADSGKPSFDNVVKDRTMYQPTQVLSSIVDIIVTYSTTANEAVEIASLIHTASSCSCYIVLGTFIRYLS